MRLIKKRRLGQIYPLDLVWPQWENLKIGFLNTDAYGTYCSWDNEKQNSVRLIINPKIEFPLTRFYGLTISPMIQINKSRTYFGIGIGYMFGLLRERKDKV